MEYIQITICAHFDGKPIHERHIYLYTYIYFNINMPFKDLHYYYLKSLSLHRGWFY